VMMRVMIRLTPTHMKIIFNRCNAIGFFYFAPVFKYIFLYVLICLHLIAGCWTKMVGDWLRRRRGGGAGWRTRHSRTRHGRRRSRTALSSSRRCSRTTVTNSRMMMTLSRTPQVLAPHVRGASTYEVLRVSLGVPYFETGGRRFGRMGRGM
jgi:hypothetical protein